VNLNKCAGCRKLDRLSVSGDVRPMLNPTHRQLLRALYALAADDRHADLSLVASAIGASCVETDRQLAVLERAGLVDADRVRLTLVGLALAVSLSEPAARHATRAA
jgi:hypothetical protein